MNETPFRDRLHAATEAGLLWGIKATLALAVPILILVFLLADYARVREDASYAAGVIRQSLAAQQQQQQARPAATAPGPVVTK